MAVAIEEKTAQRMWAATKRVEGTAVDKTQDADSGPLANKHTFWAELIEEDPANPGAYSFKKMRSSAGVLVDWDPPFTSNDLYTAREVHNHSGLPEGTRVILKYVGVDEASEADPKPPIYLFCFDRMPGVTFVVDLESDGGSDGDGSTAATWTYTATSLGGVELGTSLAPRAPRDSIGPRNQASAGLGYYDANGDFKLAVAWETLPTDQCPEEGE